MRPIEPLEGRLLLATTYAFIGDYGNGSQGEADVAALVDVFNPDYVLTMGDNNYPDGAASTIDQNIGQFYHQYIFNYQGIYGTGSPTRRFLPSLGNHDWNTPGAQPYLEYFDLPGNERYYEFVAGSVRFFLIDSDLNEPHGTASNSQQGQWLQQGLAAATEPFKLVLFHHAPYSSGVHGNSAYMQWPFEQWGASAVIAGHDHHYERLNVGGLPYFVNGVGGAEIRGFGTIVPGSELRFNGDYGAMLAGADGTTMQIRFYTRTGVLIDIYTIHAADPQPASVTVAATDPSASEAFSNPATFTFTRSGSTGGALTVNYTLAGLAANGTDYVAIPGAVTFSSGAATASVTILPIDDGIVEGAETVTLNLSPSDLYNMGAANSALAGINDNDAFTDLVSLGGVWKYDDTNTNLGTIWRAPGFNDSGWDSGPAQLGFGDGDEDTVIDGGPANNRYITHYFRRSFMVTDASKVTQLMVDLLRDDGAVIYLNGIEVWRSNMPVGTINWQTLAASGVGGDDESAIFSQSIALAPLVTGNNVLAVELHQASLTSSDASFDFALKAAIDTVVPSSPSAPDLAAGSDSGSSSSDNITNDNTPTFIGTAEPGMTVRLFANGTQVGSAVAADGTWSITSSVLAEGQRTIHATTTDLAGNASGASPSLLVRIDTSAPTVPASQFALGISPMRLVFTFSEDVQSSLSLADLNLRNLTSDTIVPSASMSLAYDAVLNTATVRFPGFGGGILPDGDYRATFASGSIQDVAGNALASSHVYDFFFLQGDANRDRRVNLIDYNIVASNFGAANRTFLQGDFNFDGVVNLSDYNILAGRFGTLLGNNLRK